MPTDNMPTFNILTLQELQAQLLDICERMNKNRESFARDRTDEDERYISLMNEISKGQAMVAADRKKSKDNYLKAIEACDQNDKFYANKKRRAYNDHIREMAHLKSEHARNNVLLENERALLFSQYKAHGGDMEIIKSLYNDNKKDKGGKENGEQ
jgi:hypothetical protein